MHTAFELSPLVTSEALEGHVISSLLVHANRIIVGTQSGGLLVFELSNATTSSTNGDDSRRPSAELVTKEENVFGTPGEGARKSIDQLGVIKELNALIILAGGDLTLHTLSPPFSLLSSFSSYTKSQSTLFIQSTIIHTPISTASSSRRSASTSTMTTDTAGIPEIHTTLAIGSRRKLIVLSWIDGAWEGEIELSLPHQIRGMDFCPAESSGQDTNQRKILAGFSTGEYGFIALPKLGSTGSNATLGNLFHPTIPGSVLSELANLAAASSTTPVSNSAPNIGGAPLSTTSSTSTLPPSASYSDRFGFASKLTNLSSLSNLGNLSLGLGGLGMGMGLASKKVERNNVVALPGPKGKGKEVDRNGREWMEGRNWGRNDDESAGEDGGLLVIRENLILPLTNSGKAKSLAVPSSVVSCSGASRIKQGIIYPSSIDETVLLPPYILSLLPSTFSNTSTLPASATIPAGSDFEGYPGLAPTLSIHSIDSFDFIQSVPIPSTRLASSSSSTITSAPTSSSSASTTSARFLTLPSSTAGQSPLLLLSSATYPTTSANNGSEISQTIWLVGARSWEKQIEELGKAGKWEEAIRLLRGAQGGDVSPTTMRKLSILHSLYLFRANLYDLAIDAFISLDLSPAKVVALYPEAISGKLLIDRYAQEGLFGGREEDRVREQEVEDEEVRRKESDEMEGRNNDDERMGSLRGSLKGSVRLGKGSKSALRDVGALEAFEQDRAIAADKLDVSAKLNFSRSVDVLIRYLTDRRQKCAQALSSTLPSLRPLPSMPRPSATQSELLALPDIPLADLTPDQLARVAQVIDTALFKSYLATKPVMVGPLCRIENWCEVEEVEDLLLTAQKYRELLDLYNGKNMHEKAVKLLRKMSESEDDQEEKVGPTVRYLQKLGSSHLELIFNSSRWIFEADRAAGLEIFIADLEEVETLPRHATMEHLVSIGADVCIAYLEHIIHHLDEEGAEFSEKLIELYLDASQASMSPTEDETYHKLIDLLESSTAYRADRILGRLPSEDMYEVRAILLGRLGRHEGALQIYVYQLENYATAEEYCQRVYSSIPAMRPTIFHILLSIYLRPRASHPLLFTPALSLISSHASQIDAVQVFDLLPPLVALSDIRVFLEKALRRSGERRREEATLRGIAGSLREKGEMEVVQLEERRVKIDQGRLCPHCNKRLGNSVIAIHSPHGEVTHYQCREEFLANRSY